MSAKRGGWGMRCGIFGMYGCELCAHRAPCCRPMLSCWPWGAMKTVWPHGCAVASAGLGTVALQAWHAKIRPSTTIQHRSSARRAIPTGRPMGTKSSSGSAGSSDDNSRAGAARLRKSPMRSANRSGWAADGGICRASYRPRCTTLFDAERYRAQLGEIGAVPAGLCHQRPAQCACDDQAPALERAMMTNRMVHQP